MNRYTVVYLNEADENLIAIWADAADRDRVTAAADAVDRMFAVDPLKDAIELSEQLWRRDVPPLRFYFEVREEDRVVVISNVVRLPD